MMAVGGSASKYRKALCRRAPVLRFGTSSPLLQSLIQSGPYDLVQALLGWRFRGPPLALL